MHISPATLNRRSTESLDGNAVLYFKNILFMIGMVFRISKSPENGVSNIDQFLCWAVLRLHHHHRKENQLRLQVAHRH